MGTDHLRTMSADLNDARFEALHLYRRNAALHPVAATVNCILGCFISGYAEPLAALIPRCRTHMVVLTDPSPLSREYLALVEAFLVAAQEWASVG